MNAPPPVVAHEREAKPTLWRFTCTVCGRRSGSFSLKDSAEAQARAHARDRCPGPEQGAML